MASPIHEEQLVEMLHRKDVNSLSYLYDNYSAALYGVVNRIVSRNEIAEEVLQDVFTKIWRNAESYDASKGRLFTWMVNIARNTAIDATRQKGYNRTNQELEKVVNDIDISQSVVFNTETIDLKQLTQRLTPEYKNLIDLIYFQGYTQVEAAELLQIPLGTVKTRLRVAIYRLKEFF